MNEKTALKIVLMILLYIEEQPSDYIVSTV